MKGTDTVGFWRINYRVSELKNLIDPLYVDIKNDVNVLIYTRSFNIFTR